MIPHSYTYLLSVILIFYSYLVYDCNLPDQNLSIVSSFSVLQGHPYLLLRSGLLASCLDHSQWEVSYLLLICSFFFFCFPLLDLNLSGKSLHLLSLLYLMFFAAFVSIAQSAWRSCWSRQSQFYNISAFGNQGLQCIWLFLIILDRKTQLIYRFILNINCGKFFHEVCLHQQYLSVQFLLGNSFVHSNNIMENARKFELHQNLNVHFKIVFFHQTVLSFILMELKKRFRALYLLYYLKEMNTKEINQLIDPYQIFYDETLKKNYYFNTQTNESIWQLPKQLHERVQTYLASFQTVSEPRLNIYKHIPKEFVRKQKKKYLAFTDTLERPARKQVETSLANNYTYKEGDEEYNFWYGKYICSKDQKDKQAALTRCNPELDVGYTAADLFNQKGAAYYCLFFARGCCANGVNCRYYHKIPCIEDCECIDQTKDIFGRSRFSSFREDMKGVGSFAKQTKAIYVSEYRLPGTEHGVTQMYEVLLRHFSMWGQVEDINILPHKGYAFIKYVHRCMAEFAKEAMTNQTLDQNQMLTIKWANEDPNPRVTEVEQNEQRKMLLASLDKKKRMKERDDKKKNIKEQRQKVINSMMKNFKVDND